MRVGERWGFIDTSGKTVIAFRYDDVGFPDKGVLEEKLGFFCGFAKVKIADKWGVIDTTGRMVVPAVFDSASELMGGSFGMLPVKKKTWGFMDTTGQMVIEPKYSEVGLFWNQEMLEREKSYYLN